MFANLVKIPFEFLSVQTLTLILIICTSALHLYLLTIRENLDFRHALKEGAGSAVGFCMSVLIIWPVAALLLYHMRVSNLPFLDARHSQHKILFS
jgi:palmitoyltransferase ZDHHC9/14/18